MKFMGITFFVLGLGLWIFVFSGLASLDNGGVICVGGGLIFMSAGLLAASNKEESVEKHWDSDKKQLVFKSNTGALATFPYAAFADFHSYRYTVSSTDSQNRRRSYTRYGVQAEKRDGSFLCVDSGFDSEGRAKEKAQELKTRTKCAESEAAPPANPLRSTDFQFSSSVTVRQTGSLSQWEWSSDRGLAQILGIPGIAVGVSINVVGLILFEDASKLLALVIPFALLIAFAIVKGLWSSRGTGQRLTLQGSKLVWEKTRSEKTVDTATVDLTDVGSVVIQDGVLCLFKEAKHWQDSLLQVDIGTLLAVDQFALENHLGDVIAQKTGRDSNTI